MRERQPLTLKPLFSDQEREAILGQWQQDELERQQKRIKLVAEEDRLLRLETTTRTAELLGHYNHVMDMRYQGISATMIESSDDVLVLVRHATPHIVHSESNPNLTDGQGLKKHITVLQQQDLERARLAFPIGLYFPSYHYALIAAFPKYDIQMFQFARTPLGYWTDPEKSADKVQEAIKYFTEDEIGIKKEPPEQFRDFFRSLNMQDFFKKHNLYQRFISSGYIKVSAAVIDTYPELKLKPWEFRSYYQGEEGTQLRQDAVRWLIEERLGLPPQDPKFKDYLKMIRAQHFKEVGLSSFVSKGISLPSLIIQAYPDLGLTEANFFRFPSHYWQGELARQRAIEQIRSMIETELSLSPEDPDFRKKLAKVRSADFHRYGLGGMLATLFGNSSSAAVTVAYAELQLKEWEIGTVPNSYWHKNNYENVGHAVRWLVEQKLGFSPDGPDFKTKVLRITRNIFSECRLGGMLGATHLTIYQTLQIAYPSLNVTLDEYISSNRWRTTSLRRAAEQLNLKQTISSEEAERNFDVFFGTPT